MLKTARLELIVCERTHLAAFSHGKDTLADLLGVQIPVSWPTFPEAFALPPGSQDESDPVWPALLFINPSAKILVGNGGFKGGPDDAGAVEIGYEIASELWNQGFATEAARAMIAYAFTHPTVQAVIAHTLAETNASNAVLQKLGMTFDGDIPDPEVGAIWRWQVSRASFGPTSS